MKSPLRKRIPRELKGEIGKYLVVFKDSKISPTVLTEKIRDELTEQKNDFRPFFN